MNDLESGGPSSQEPAPPRPGLFDGVNNYVLLVYAVACFLMYNSLVGLLYLEKMYIAETIAPGLAAIVVPLALISRRSPAGFFGEYRVRGPRIPETALAVVTSAAAILPVGALSGVIAQRYPANEDYISFLLAIKPKGPLSFVLVGFGMVVVAAIAEELLFRGFVQRIFQRNMRPELAIVFAGVLFGCCHFDLPTLPTAAILGTFFGYLFWKTGNLLYPIMGHAVFNLAMLIELASATAEEISSPVYTTPALHWIALSIVVFAAGFWLLSRRPSPPPDHA